MQQLIKVLNKFNGNLCFVGATDTGDVIFECDRDNETLSYDSSSKLIYDVALVNSNSYSVAFADAYIGRFSGGTLDETHTNTGLNSVDKIEADSQGNTYILNRVDNQLVKYNSGIVWTFDLPDYSLRYDGQIILRESDGMIVYHNNSNVHVVRDDSTEAVLLSTVAVSGSGDMKAVISGEFNPSYCYARARTTDGSDLDQSSSSSSSYSSSSSLSSNSSSSDSSSSSSSLSSDSSSSSSSLGYSESSSSSSLGYSESSSSSSYYWQWSEVFSGASGFWGIATSEDGQYITAGGAGVIARSDDYGLTWGTPISTSPTHQFRRVAMSSNGASQTIASGSVPFPNQIYVSHDYGVTWTPKGAADFYTGAAVSSNGASQTVTIFNGQIYVSHDYGNTWTPKDSNRQWVSVAMSSNGASQTAVVEGGQIYVSHDYGNTWTAKDSSRNWSDVSISSNGSSQSAVVFAGSDDYIYVSNDYGNTWNTTIADVSSNGIDMTFDGQLQISGTVSAGSPAVYLSNNYGQEWSADIKAPVRGSSPVAISGNDGDLRTFADGGSIFVYRRP